MNVLDELEVESRQRNENTKQIMNSLAQINTETLDKLVESNKKVLEASNLLDSVKVCVYLNFNTIFVKLNYLKIEARFLVVYLI